MDHRIRIKECEKRDKNENLARELKTMDHEGDDDTNCNWYARNNLHRTGKETGRLGNKRTSGDHRR